MESVGDKINAMHLLRENKREMERRIKELEGQIQVIERDLIDSMDSQGLKLSQTERARAEVIEATVPNIDDWDSFCAYVRKHNAFYLMERRPSASACNEMFGLRKTIPGITAFTKRKIRLVTK